MKRLTTRTNDRVILAVERQPGGEPLHSRIRDLQRAANERLAEYEDTGLTPQEISDIVAREDNVQEVNDRIEERCKTLEDKHWEECRQIALYDDELRQANQKSRGFWIDKGTLKDYPKPGVDVYHLLICSKCGCMHRARFLDAFKRFSNAQYCPNCGARMDGGANG